MRRRPSRVPGGCTFAENPNRPAPIARIIWHADLDPGTLHVVALPCAPDHPDGITRDRLTPWLAVETDREGREHAVLSDGWHRIRLDIDQGSIAVEAVLLRYQLAGTVSAEPKILPLRRLIDLCRRGRFARSLFPDDPRIARWVTMLQVHDALAAGATQREIGVALFGEARIAQDWNAANDSLRSRVRRLVGGTQTMARGGYRRLLLPGR